MSQLGHGATTAPVNRLDRIPQKSDVLAGKGPKPIPDAAGDGRARTCENPGRVPLERQIGQPKLWAAGRQKGPAAVNFHVAQRRTWQ